MFGKDKGFTLAEVLITLTILGVVAAITVPALQKQNYKKTNVSRMAKGYASLEKAVANIAQNTNCIGKDLKCTGLLDITDSQELNNRFAELANFRVSKYSSGCTVTTISLYCENNKSSECSSDSHGSTIPIFYTTPDNLAYSLGISNVNTKNGVTPALRVHIITDEKKLNKIYGSCRTNAVLGRTDFIFAIYDNFIVEPLFQGEKRWALSNASKEEISRYLIKYCDPNEHTSSVSTIDGANCSSRIIKDGWKMKY